MIWYVRADGNDANDGQLASQAFLTLDKARSVANAGDIVDIGAGSFAVPSDQLICPAHTTWRGAGNASTTIAGVGTGSPPVATILVGEGVTIQDVTVQSHANDGGCISTSSTSAGRGVVTVRRCVLQSSIIGVLLTDDGSGAYAARIAHCTCAAPIGVHIRCSLVEIMIAGCTFTGARGVRFQADGVEVVRGTIESCTFDASSGDGQGLIQIEDGDVVDVLINLCTLTQGNANGLAILNAHGSSVIRLGRNSISGAIQGAVSADQPMRQYVLDRIRNALEDIGAVGAVYMLPKADETLPIADVIGENKVCIVAVPLDDEPAAGEESRETTIEHWQFDMWLICHLPTKTPEIDGITQGEYAMWLMGHIYEALVSAEPRFGAIEGNGVLRIESTGGGAVVLTEDMTEALTCAYSVDYEHARGRAYKSAGVDD